MAMKKAARKSVKHAAPAQRSTHDPREEAQPATQLATQPATQSWQQTQSPQSYNQGSANFNSGGNRFGNNQRGGSPSVFTFVTGLWPGKKENTIGYGKCKREQIEKVIAVLQDALQKGVEVRFSVFAPGQYTHAQAIGDLALSFVDPNYGGGRSAGRGYPQRSAPAPQRQNFFQRQNFPQPSQNQGWESQELGQGQGEDINFG